MKRHYVYEKKRTIVMGNRNIVLYIIALNNCHINALIKMWEEYKKPIIAVEFKNGKDKVAVDNEFERIEKKTVLTTGFHW